MMRLHFSKFVLPMTFLAAPFGLITQAANASTTVLKTGSQGVLVTEVQSFLSSNHLARYYSSALDGDFGPLTRAALMAWQKASAFSPSGQISYGSHEWTVLADQSDPAKLPNISALSLQAASRSGWSVDAEILPSSSGNPLGYVSVIGLDPATHRETVTYSSVAAYGGWNYSASGLLTHYFTPTGIYQINFEWGRNGHPQLVSTAFHNAAMKWAACFIGTADVCFHVDPLGPSHGCVHIPSESGAFYIDSLPIGTFVDVHQA